jgi:hypothetical protein
MIEELHIRPTIDSCGVDTVAFVLLEGNTGCLDRFWEKVRHVGVGNNLGGPIKLGRLAAYPIDFVEGKRLEILASTRIEVPMP